MSLTYYISLYGLAEALVLSLILTSFFGVQWWKLHRIQRQNAKIFDAVVKLFKQEIVHIQDQPVTRSELRDAQVSLLKTIAVVFHKKQLSSLTAWEKVIEHIRHYFSHLAQVTRSIEQNHHDESQETAAENVRMQIHDASDFEDGSVGQLDLALDHLLAHYQATTSAMAINQEAALEMKQNYQSLQCANQELRARLQAKNDQEIWEKFDEYEQSNAAFMRALSVKERNYKLLVKEHETLQVHIHNLQVTIDHYRKSMHKILFKQNSLQEENKLLLEQQESTNHLVKRLNQNYEILRNEYTKLFESMR